MKKRQQHIFKSVCVLLLVVVWMASVVFAGSYSGGTGEPNEPYIIASEADLLELSNEPNDLLRHFLLAEDLDLSGIDLKPIGWIEGSEFTGVFDGNNHKIYHLTLNLPEEDYVGLFGRIGSNGTIKNLGLDGINVTGNHMVGGLVAKCFQGSIFNCYSKGEVIGDGYVGGLVGYSLESTVSNCFSTAAVKGGSYPDVGGLVGLNTRSYIEHSYVSTGTVQGDRLVVGLVGYNPDSTVIHCYSNAEVVGDSDRVGGLVGESSGSVINCYATGTVEGNESVGGLVPKQAYSGRLFACVWLLHCGYTNLQYDHVVALADGIQLWLRHSILLSFSKGFSFSQHPYRDLCCRLSNAEDGGSFQTPETRPVDIDSSQGVGKPPGHQNEGSGRAG